MVHNTPVIAFFGATTSAFINDDDVVTDWKEDSDKGWQETTEAITDSVAVQFQGT